MTDSIRDALLIVVSAIAIRNFVFLHYHLRGSLLIDVFLWFLRLIGFLVRDPSGGDTIMQAGKGKDGAPDGRVLVLDADGNVCAEWPKSVTIEMAPDDSPMKTKKKDPVTRPATDFHKKDE